MSQIAIHTHLDPQLHARFLELAVKRGLTPDQLVAALTKEGMARQRAPRPPRYEAGVAQVTDTAGAGAEAGVSAEEPSAGGAGVSHPLSRQYLAWGLAQIDAAVLAVQEAAGWLREANEADDLPAGFLDHRADLKSAEATVARVAADIRATLREP